ncbi:hypothetical protein O6H91_01G150500 [Diphasiastrum complanatum]|uniref:Uncharacterized protein n=1 Tax=Diphasiastrum complanatum TaxID=34168 RepID=A0ACC2EX92_DIPCM|nr:hypothetical protein O6H91_01G150500 [Diphasiastrum complanatum]
MEALRWPQAHSTNGLQTHWIKHGSVGGRKKSSLISLKPNFESTLFHGLIASAASKQQQQQPHKPKPDSSSSSKRKKSSSTPPSRRPSSSSSSSSSSSRSSLRTKEGKVSVAEQISLKNVRSKDNNLKEELEDVDLPFHQLLKPPAGFILDEEGKVVLMAPDGKRVVSMVEKETGRSLECLIRRAFSSSQGRQCFILLPLDTPLQILRIEEKMRSLSELTEPELEEVLPTAAYALAKKRMHLVVSGFCLTARGGFCFTEDEVMDLETGEI